MTSSGVRFFIALFTFHTLVGLCGGEPLLAQQDSLYRQSLDATVAQDAVTIWQDAGTIFTAPLHFDDRAWLTTGAVAGGTLLLFTLDESARGLAQRNQSATADNIFSLGTEYGRAIYGVALSGGLYVGGLVSRNNNVRRTGVMLFESIAFAGITTTVIKSLAGRSRPYLEEGPVKFRGPGFADEHFSLPSGHSTVAFSVSSVLSARVKNIYATIGLYSLAALTSCSRVYQDEHWFSDTLLGAAIGTAVGISVVNLHEERMKQSSIWLSPTLHGVRIAFFF